MKRLAMSGVARLALLGAMTLAVYAQVPANRPENVAATLLEFEGRVSVLRGNVPWALSNGDAVKPREVIVTGPDGQAVFRVDDGSTFRVYPNSRATFRGDYNPANLLDVIIGKIKVHIQRWGGLPNNTTISSPTAVISVRGTTFDVEVDPQDEWTEVAVEEGEVAVKHQLIYNEQPRILRGGDRLKVYKNVPLAKAKMDKMPLLERGLRAGMDALNTILYRGTRPGTGGPNIPTTRGPSGDTNGGGQSDPGTPAPPPPTPPPPPPQ